MEKRLISELNMDELKALYEKNSFMREECSKESLFGFEITCEDFFRYISNVKGLDYNFGYPGNYMNFRAYSADYYEDFFKACIDTEKVFSIFSDDTMKKIEKAYSKAGFYQECTYGYEEISEKRYNDLDRLMTTTFEKAKNELFRAYSDLEDYYYSDAAAIDCIDVWAENHGDDYETDGEKLYETTYRVYA